MRCSGSRNCNHTFRDWLVDRILIYSMIIQLADDADRRPRKRMRRHGNDVELIMEKFIDGKPAPFSLLFKSNQTGRYHWYDRKQLKPIEFYDSIEIKPPFDEYSKAYTPNKELFDEYLDHLMDKVLSKRDKKRWGPLYEKMKNPQTDLFDLLSA